MKACSSESGAWAVARDHIRDDEAEADFGFPGAIAVIVYPTHMLAVQLGIHIGAVVAMNDRGVKAASRLEPGYRRAIALDRAKSFFFAV